MAVFVEMGTLKLGTAADLAPDEVAGGGSKFATPEATQVGTSVAAAAAIAAAHRANDDLDGLGMRLPSSSGAPGGVRS